MSKKDPITSRLVGLRYSNASGKVIPMHHAFLTLQMHSISRVSAIVLPIFFVALIWLCMPLIADFWGEILAYWTQNIYGTGISTQNLHILGQDFNLYTPALEAYIPSQGMVYWNMVICLTALCISFMLPGGWAPFVYIMRAAIIIQASASLDQILSPEFFPYSLPGYMRDTLSLSLYLLFLLPVTLGFVYYIFDFSLVRKIALTLFMLIYFIAVLPCQYMLHAVIIHEYTVLFLPVLYLLFGTLLDVLMFMSIYAVGMSMGSRPTALQGRGL